MCVSRTRVEKELRGDRRTRGRETRARDFDLSFPATFCLSSACAVSLPFPLSVSVVTTCTSCLSVCLCGGRERVKTSSGRGTKSRAENWNQLSPFTLSLSRSVLSCTQDLSRSPASIDSALDTRSSSIVSLHNVPDGRLSVSGTGKGSPDTHTACRCRGDTGSRDTFTQALDYADRILLSLSSRPPDLLAEKVHG